MLNELFFESLRTFNFMSSTPNSKVKEIADLLIAIENDLRQSNLLSTIEVVRVKRGEYLEHSGEAPQFLYFFDSNSYARIFIDKDGVELTTDFVLPFQFASDFSSFALRTSSPYSIVMLTDSNVFRIHYNHYLRMKQSCPRVDELESVLMAFRLENYQYQINELRFLNATERYCWLAKSKPQLVKNVSSVHLAQYLGISPECLCRIRAKIREMPLLDHKESLDYIIDLRF
ncbi:MAG TPA: Crp/Fnr family transcriptional regulator [Paludibacter sp.]|nr:Crp/Fnr family transcriptional regulator [Paludibacter sp.]